MIKVQFVQLDGTGKTIENVRCGQSLMEVARANRIDGILAECGGACACATCHVYVHPAWQEMAGNADDTEEMMLDAVSEVRRSNSRLSCQIDLRPELDGLTVTIAPAIK